MQLYKKAGAKYFMSMGVHHDNFDLWNSKYQPRWNAVATGPKKTWSVYGARRRDKHGLRFAVSEHLSNSYDWFATSHTSDKTGPLAGVPYDGQDAAYNDLYHPSPNNPSPLPPAMGRKRPIRGSASGSCASRIWWITTIPTYFIPMAESPSARRASSWFRTITTRTPSCTAAKWKASSPARPRGIATQGTCALDIERGVANEILAQPWQTDTCIGNWHYKKGIKYKTPKTVIDLLCDIVSRNGNLMLNFPLPNSGMLDDDELKVLDGITQWMAVNSEGIYGTRPWKVAGNAAPPPAASAEQRQFNERNRKDLTAADIRFTAKNGVVYAFLMGWPDSAMQAIPQLALGGNPGAGKIRRVELLGHKGNLKFTQNETALSVELPREKPSDYAVTLKIEGA